MAALSLCGLVVSCTTESARHDTAGQPDAVADTNDDLSSDATANDESPTDDADKGDTAADSAGPLTFVAVTYNTGTSEGMVPSDAPNDGYTQALAKISDEWYGDGLAWLPAVEAATQFFAQNDADLVVFQEIFWTGECPGIPEDAWNDFICSTWSPGDPTVANEILGDGWQVMCMPGKSDKCAAVNRGFGAFRGCNEDFCLEGLEGFRVDDCGKGARVGRGVIDLVGGGTLTLVNVHGSSGVSTDDMSCRVQQFEQVFVDIGDGEPAANGARNVIMGDFNTDPARFAEVDPSAARLNDFVGDGKAFHFVTAAGLEVQPTYGGFINIDHVISDVFQGTCWHAGVTDGHPTVIETIYFDHIPAVCVLGTD